MKKAALLSICMVLSCLTYATNGTDPKKTTEDATKTQTPTETKEKMVFSGYLDSYYMSNLNNPSSRNNLGASGIARAFDQKAGQFSLGLVQAKAQYTYDKLEAVMDLTFGPNANLGNYGNAIGTALAIKQAYINYKFTDKFTFTVGQFGTHIGYEVIDAPINFHYSLSNLFNNGPFYHIGAKGTFTISDKASLMVGVVNNVDNLNDNNRKKGLISQFFVTPATGFNVYINGIYSNEAIEDDKTGKTPDATYAMLDLTTSYQINDKFLLGLNAAVGSQNGDYQKLTNTSKATTWGGAALYTTYTVSDKFTLGGRYEYFDNKGGARLLVNADGSGASVNSLTLTGNVSLADGHFLIKPEFRMDAFAKQTNKEGQQFLDSSGRATKNAQSTVGVAFICKF